MQFGVTGDWAHIGLWDQIKLLLQQIGPNALTAHWTPSHSNGIPLWGLGSVLEWQDWHCGGMLLLAVQTIFFNCALMPKLIMKVLLPDSVNFVTSTFGGCCSFRRTLRAVKSRTFHFLVLFRNLRAPSAICTFPQLLSSLIPQIHCLPIYLRFLFPPWLTIVCCIRVGMGVFTLCVSRSLPFG